MSAGKPCSRFIFYFVTKGLSTKCCILASLPRKLQIGSLNCRSLPHGSHGTVF
jgi:hypothetical protein